MITNENHLIDLAVNGDKQALENLLCNVQDMVFNLSLRMLGTVHDAEDATQEILIKVMKGLSGFRKESALSTWVYRVSVNYLINYKKSMFAEHPLSFELYAEDINNGFIAVESELFEDVDEELLSQELKASCTNVMLQCLDKESRCIYILGTMFHLDSKIAGEIMNISPEAYRQRLTRIKRRMADFLDQYCGLGNGGCNCMKRVGYAVKNHRLVPSHLEFTSLEKLNEEEVKEYTKSMEQLDQISALFSNMPKYKNPAAAKEFIKKLIDTAHALSNTAEHS